MSTWIGGEKKREEEGEREEEEAKAAAAYSVRLQQTGDEALFSAGAYQREQRSYPATEKRTHATCYYWSPWLPLPLAGLLKHIYSDTYAFNFRFGIAEPCRHTHVSHTF